MQYETTLKHPSDFFSARGIAFPVECPERLCLAVENCFSSGGNLHLAIFTPTFLDSLVCGKKTIESRFSRHRIAPWGTVHDGDLILAAKPGTVVVAMFVAIQINYYDLTLTPISSLKERFSLPVAAYLDPEFWEKRKGKRFASFIGVSEVVTLVPIKLSKRDQRGWVTFERSDYGLF